MYKMPCYEAKYFHKNYWEEISDIELMDGLYKIYNKITPVIKEMIHGKEVQTDRCRLPAEMERWRIAPMVGCKSVGKSHSFLITGI